MYSVKRSIDELSFLYTKCIRLRVEFITVSVLDQRNSYIFLRRNLDCSAVIFLNIEGYDRVLEDFSYIRRVCNTDSVF